MSTEFSESLKRLIYPNFEKKSDEELQSIALNNSKKITAMPIHATSAQVAETEKLVAEMKVASEILDARKKNRDKVNDAIQAWQKKAEEIPYDNFINLKAASSANGQLVAAILEDEGDMNSEEIAGWCDELASIDDATFQELLEELVQEQILAKTKDNKYRLINICTPTLYPENPVEWGEKLLEQAGATEFELYRMVLVEMNVMETPMNAEGIIKIWGDLKRKFGNAAYAYYTDKNEMKKILREMRKMGILQTVKLNGASSDDPYYYFNRLCSNNKIGRSVEEKTSKETEKMTTVQIENEQRKNAIVSYMEGDDSEFTITDLIAYCPELSELSNQRVTSYMRQLTDDGIVTFTWRDKNRYYSLAKKED